ncbi:hypothetical protein QFW77_12000 [Luteimonas sp. RD2P54]|uniref:HMA domain-containing protein n=1 Tax=Luteimonas endophytica TaxID=3042023 RepID=A0ABT6JA55_9GAMM|nr:hypothetical protein [Luteimonas endophytica]MDH5823710.1 hypothetical protein [Luteimonas endophytica]
MEFHVAVPGTPPDLAAVERALAALDPAALVDLDAAGATLRVSTSMAAAQLAALLGSVGCAVGEGQVIQQPSVCCGGCSG